MLVHCLSVASAIFISLRERSTLRIRTNELPRYLRKSINLALCYAGLVSERRYMQPIRAGLAAFLCCAYDVVTDWRKYDYRAIVAFDELLRRYSCELRCLALDLLEKDREGKLAHDGLERGIVSAQFITKLIGSRQHFEKLVDLEQLAMALQVVDDVLDYEADTRSGDINCLSSDHRQQYIALLERTLPEREAMRLFPHGNVLKFVIRRARKKASKIRFFESRTTGARLYL